MLPDRDRYIGYVRRILDSGILTSRGPLAEELEARLQVALDCRNLLLTSSGTVALQIACKALRLKGRVVTSPFTYVATANALSWVGLQPVFADIREDDLNMDPRCVEQLSELRPSAIMPVHVFGNPCDIDAIESIAHEWGVPTIYDAAACFGVAHRGQSVASLGSMSTLSFHSSKVFSTVEGGAVVFSDPEHYDHIRSMIHNGCARDGSIACEGTNARMSELHAAFGILSLESAFASISRRLAAIERVRLELEPDRSLRFPSWNADATENGAYCPVVFENEGAVLSTQASLRGSGFDARRYFFPCLNTVPHFASETATPVADDVSRRTLCISIEEFSDEEISRMGDIVRSRGIGATPAV